MTTHARLALIRQVGEPHCFPSRASKTNRRPQPRIRLILHLVRQLSSRYCPGSVTDTEKAYGKRLDFHILSVTL